MENGTISAETVVLAMGPWTGQASKWCGVNIPVTPLKGQILRLQADNDPLKLAVNYSHSYVATKSEVLFGRAPPKKNLGSTTVSIQKHVTVSWKISLR
ncbi:MAG: hypothetical protein Ct9H300mP11_00520 [Chloroflexota bacterium]|nr:MAG: hypothetical protein Ct9H300mP11_00520 [Chloroflexota bacterium]